MVGHFCRQLCEFGLPRCGIRNTRENTIVANFHDTLFLVLLVDAHLYVD